MAEQQSGDAAPLPASFWQYLRSFGPGLIVVLTWLGAGDLVECSVSGGNYGYALMWAVAAALAIRFLFVSLIAKYHMCNERGEGVLDGLVRLSPLYAPLLLLASVVMGHLYGAYMSVGIGEFCVALTGLGQKHYWAVGWGVFTLFIVFRPEYRRLELLFKILLAVLAGSLLGLAIWAGPDPAGIARGLFGFEMPEQAGGFKPLLLVVGLIGAMGGSIMNLVYPYFLAQKGWNTPPYRRVQMYDFLLAVAVMIVLDLAVWCIGAELFHGKGAKIENISDLAELIGRVLGRAGTVVFYLGAFAAVYTSIVGHAVGLGSIATHGWLRWKQPAGAIDTQFSSHPLYQCVVVWVVISPLVWTFPGMPGFVQLTLVVNSLQVVLIPLIAGGLWVITANASFIGEKYRNRWWENLVMLVVFGLSLWGAYGAVKSVSDEVRKMVNPAAADGREIGEDQSS